MLYEIQITFHIRLAQVTMEDAFCIKKPYVKCHVGVVKIDYKIDWNISTLLLAQLKPALHLSLMDSCNTGLNCANTYADMLQPI